MTAFRKTKVGDKYADEVGTQIGESETVAMILFLLACLIIVFACGIGIYKLIEYICFNFNFL